jgi:hypothetical protein
MMRTVALEEGTIAFLDKALFNTGHSAATPPGLIDRNVCY